MLANGYTEEFARNLFGQIEGFGSYGFPESHAASFALLVYISAWIKCHHPAVFLAALLNSQPMGFYGPAQLVADARRHGVEVRPVDVNQSDCDCTLERREEDGMLAVRLGWSTVKGLSKQRRRDGGPASGKPDRSPRTATSSHAPAYAGGSLATGGGRCVPLARSDTPAGLLDVAGADPDRAAPCRSGRRSSAALAAAFTRAKKSFTITIAQGLSLRGHPFAPLRSFSGCAKGRAGIAALQNAESRTGVIASPGWCSCDSAREPPRESRS